MQKDQKDKERPRGKVLPLDNYRRKADDGKNAENSVQQLLHHMRRMRETIPVNYQLQEELRQKLINQKENNIDHTEFSYLHKRKSTVQKVRRKVWIVSSLLFIIFLTVFWWLSSRHGALQPLGSPRKWLNFGTQKPIFLLQYHLPQEIFFCPGTVKCF
ncbi:MAG: hypothetical protein H0Z40_06160 [Desulfotomaculum sp.]|nr:hypothetical protein [Desulfotomaculum sp.]